MKNCIAVIALLAIALTGCTPEKRINNPEDIAKGTKVVETFLNGIKSKDYDKAMEMTEISKDNPEYQQHVAVFKKLDETLGGIKEFIQDTAKSDVEKSFINTQGVITLNYDVLYERGSARQDYIVTYHNSELKILSYTIGDRVYFDMDAVVPE